MAVYLRKKNLASGKQSLYLDIWNSYNNQRYYEFLKLYIVKARTTQQSEKNKEILLLAENIRAKREIEMQAIEFDYTPKFKKNISVILYYEKFLNDYDNKDIRIVKYSLEHFKKFIDSKKQKSIVTFKDMTNELCKQFKQYLENNLNGETPYNYFTKFKKMLKQAQKENLIKFNPADSIKNIKSDSLKKEILNIDEIQLIAKASCGNDEIKRAFLFCLNTGLRFCDVKELRWKNIDGNKMRITQAKTKHSSRFSQINSDLNNTAMKVIGSKGKPEDKVFKLPTIESSLKTLKHWTYKAGIDKNITWHSARHSFAVNLLNPDVVGTDIKTVSSLLGHSGLRHTEKYLHVIDESKKSAVNKLPDIEVSNEQH